MRNGTGTVLTASTSPARYEAGVIEAKYLHLFATEWIHARHGAGRDSV